MRAFVRRCDLSRMKLVQDVLLQKLVQEHFVLVKVSTLLNKADYLTKQYVLRKCTEMVTFNIVHIMAGGRAKTVKRMIGEAGMLPNKPLRPNSGLAEEE